jgi:transposase InsO family protein
LTWDQGVEMREWKQVAIDAGIEIFFCDPHSPWQRGINENPNGLLRQYFPKGTDLSVHSETDLDWVAAELNDRPRKRLAFEKPIEAIGKLLLQYPLETADRAAGGMQAPLDARPRASIWTRRTLSSQSATGCPLRR